jgi:hypothetical protein
MRTKIPNSTLVPLVVAGGFILLVAYFSNWVFVHTAAHATAYVIDKEETFHSYKGGGSEYKIGVSYLMAGGETHYAQTLVNFRLYESLNEQDVVPILYDAQNLDHIQTVHDADQPGWLRVLEALTLSFAVVAVAQRYPNVFLKKLW